MVMVCRLYDPSCGAYASPDADMRLVEFSTDITIYGAADCTLRGAIGIDHFCGLAPNHRIAGGDGLTSQAQNLERGDNVGFQDTSHRRCHMSHIHIHLADSTTQIIDSISIRGNA
ncbi:hypothetical protein RRF57_009426 [Xylaria bambusicola]|uniref:Uncharacterized protein n=1 Tax=Xylaria bambusicola TaxID=326684 RepID=A0AAN7Z8Z0_9PEZI